MVLPFLLHIPLLVVIAFVLKRKFIEDPLSKYYWGALICKMLAGISVGLIYLFYYNSTGDTFTFHINASNLTAILFDNPGEFFRIFFYNDFSTESQNLIHVFNEPRVISYLRIISLLNILTFSNYWINALYLSLFAFTGIWMLSNTLVKIFQLTASAAAFAFLFFPTFVFWTSGILKESFVIGSLFLIMDYTLQYIHQKRKVKIFEVILLLVLAYYSWEIKFYYVLIALPCLLSYWLLLIIQKKFTLIKKPIAAIFSFLLIVGLIALATVLMHPGFTMNILINLLYENYSIILSKSKILGKFAYEFENFGPEISKIALNSPKALFIGLFRPYIWESSLNLTFFVGVENLLIMILFIGKLYYIIKNPSKLKTETIVVLTYIILTATLMALISPNWGTLSRYKCAFTPFWILFLSINNPIFIMAIEKLKTIKIGVSHK